jgi:hypothetical protein
MYESFDMMQTSNVAVTVEVADIEYIFNAVSIVTNQEIWILMIK